MAEPASKPPPRFQRLARMPRKPPDPVFLAPPESTGKGDVQCLNVGLRKHAVRVTNRPARHPQHGLWPWVLRAAQVAPQLDFETTRQLCRAIADGNAPRPRAVRGSGASAEVVWSLDAVKAFVAARHRIDDHTA
jgi:hypothetical protein